MDNYSTSLLKFITLPLIIFLGIVSIIASNGNSNPQETVACIKAIKQVRTGSEVVLDSRCSEIRDFVDERQELYFSWKFIDRPAGSNASFINGSTDFTTGLFAKFIADVDGVYTVQLATDVNGGGIHDDYATINITASTGNARPVAEAGAYQEVKVGDIVQLNGSGFDADDNPLTYSWQFQPDSESSNLSSPTSSTTTFVADRMTDYYIDLIVNDGAVDSHNDAIVIKSKDINQSAPVAIAGSDQFVSVDSQVNLNAGSSYSAFNKALSYHWRILHQPFNSTASLTASDAAQTSFIADRAGYYLVRLKVSDALTQEANHRSVDGVYEDRLVITAGENQPPTADGGSDQSINTGSTVILDGIDSSDPEAQTLTYHWSVYKKPAGSTADVTSIDTQTTELIPDRDGNYLIRLVVNDGVDDSPPDIVRISASSLSGVTQMTLVTSLPYIPVIMESATLVQIDTDGSDSIGLISSSDTLPANFSTAMMIFPDGPNEAQFSNVTGWSIISPSTLIINDSTTPAFIIQRSADGMYYKIVLDFTVEETLVQIDALEAWRCGTNPADCP